MTDLRVLNGIKVVVSNARGPRGLRGAASGPLGADSVVSETIAGDPVEQAAILDKLALEGLSVSDRLLDADPARDVLGGSPGPGKLLNFRHGHFVGSTPEGLKLLTGATGIINDARQLEIDAPYDSAPAKRAFFPDVYFHAGRLLWRVVRGSGMLRMVNRAFEGRAVYMSAGGLFYGYIDGNGAVEGFGQGPLAGADGDLIWIELLTGPAYNGSGWALRSWKDGEARPEASISGMYGATRRFNEGALMLSSYAGSTVKTSAILVQDGSDASANIHATASLEGRWFTDFQQGMVVESSIRIGSRWRSRVTGATGVRTVFQRGADDTLPPVVAATVNGVLLDEYIEIAGANGAAVIRDFPTGLDPKQTYDIEWIVRGMQHGNDKWGKGTGVSLIRSRPIGDNGKLEPLPDRRRKLLWIGDSITESSRARGFADVPTSFGGDISFARLTSEALGYSPILSAFGGTGLVVGNLSNQPSAIDGGQEPNNGATYPFGHAWHYMWDRSIDTAAENIEAVIVNLGTNDNSRGVPPATFQAAYTAFLQELLLRHPRARRIVAVQPFGGFYGAQIQAAVNALGQPERLAYFDTSTWTDITYADGVHPDGPGHAAAAGHFIDALPDILP